MRAIFSNFGKRANAERRQDTQEHSSNTKTWAGNQDTSRFHATYPSLDHVGGGIGDAPSKAPDYADANHGREPRSQASISSPWAFKLSGSIRSTSSRREVSEPSNVALLQPLVPAPTSRVSHPSSSYKNPSPQAENSNITSGTALGLIRKFSVNSRRGSPPSSESHAASATRPATVPLLEQLPSTSNLGSVRWEPVSPHRAPSSANAVSFPRPIKPPANTEMPTGADISAMSPEELGARLSELAVANADGLLSDDEYRTLRQAVFDCMMQGDKESMTALTAAGLTGSGLLRHVRSPDVLAAESALGRSASTDRLAVQSGSSHGHDERRATSTHSGRRGKASSFQIVTDMFRKGRISSKGMHPQISQYSQSSHDLANREGVHRFAPSRRNSAGMSSQLSGGEGHSLRASSFRTQQTSAAKSSRVSTFGRLRAGSQARRAQAENAARDIEGAFSAERTVRSLRAVSLYVVGSVDLPNSKGGTSERSPTSLRSEMAPSTMFGAEYAEKPCSEIQAEMAVVQAEGNRMLDTYKTLEGSLMSKQNALGPLVVDKVIERVRGLIPLGCVTRLEGQRPPHASSYRTPRQPHGEEFVPQDVASFEAELTKIYMQKAAIVKRYQDRLGFLESKLRSAGIREGLKG
ncbi:uncharacterized protein MEPE_02603 [Melanopsichium pennsylvanicum]|uniref:Uncharacterized protein n=2 Tax=Melanopsichium pennsylvanicum TaxID=63383 RepID=A0AAJ5C4Q4_9BASI|nr:putative protein [Melanopsichium pennsylvanicum 4]SNX83895.1 uncharacterized protein MEPE_02603 [Melanopsichium pennsylvanicum]